MPSVSRPKRSTSGRKSVEKCDTIPSCSGSPYRAGTQRTAAESFRVLRTCTPIWLFLEVLPVHLQHIGMRHGLPMTKAVAAMNCLL